MSTIQAPALFVAGHDDTVDLMEPLAAAAHTSPKRQFEVLDTSHLSVVDAPDETTFTHRQLSIYACVKDLL